MESGSTPRTTLTKNWRRSPEDSPLNWQRKDSWVGPSGGTSVIVPAVGVACIALDKFVIVHFKIQKYEMKILVSVWVNWLTSAPVNVDEL